MVGNLDHDAEVRTTQAATKVAGFVRAPAKPGTIGRAARAKNTRKGTASSYS
jgi:hypothetical protein